MADERGDGLGRPSGHDLSAANWELAGRRAAAALKMDLPVLGPTDIGHRSWPTKERPSRPGDGGRSPQCGLLPTVWVDRHTTWAIGGVPLGLAAYVPAR